MPGRRALALLLACGLAGAGATTALAAGNYGGDARGIALTAAQARYKTLTGSADAPKPPADKKHGFLSGWQAAYLKGTAKAPIEALSLIYVYATTADAKRAYTRSCANCSEEVTVEGIAMKLQLTGSKGTPGVITIATCRNIYVAIVITGKLDAGALARAAGALAGGTYSKAMSGGMSPCKAA